MPLLIFSKENSKALAGGRLALPLPGEAKDAFPFVDEVLTIVDSWLQGRMRQWPVAL